MRGHSGLKHISDEQHTCANKNEKGTQRSRERQVLRGRDIDVIET